MKPFYISVLAALAFPFVASAFDVKDISVKNFSTGEGLSHHSVNAICQDEHGFLWIGTQDGLNRYDGHHFEVFKPSSSDGGNGLLENNIRSLCCDGDGHLYIKGLNSLTEYDMRSGGFKMIAARGIKSMFYDGTNLWVSDAKTLSIYNRGSGTFEEAFRFRAGMEDAVIRCFAIGRAGQKYIATDGLGFIEVNQNGNIIRHLELSNANSIIEDSAGNVWIATLSEGAKMLSRDGKVRNFRRNGSSPEATAFNNVRYICEDSSGNIWMTTFGGLVKIDAQTRSMVQYRYSFKQEALNIRSVSSIFIDRQGTIWLGSFHDGLSSFNPADERFSFYKARRSLEGALNSPIVSTMVEDGGGNVFVGTEGGWVNVLDRKSGIFKLLPYPADASDMSVKSMIYDDKEKILYVSSLFGGITLYDVSGRPKVLSSTRLAGTLSNTVAMIEYGRDSILLATMEALKVYDKRSGRILPFETGFKSDYISQVWDVEIDEVSNVWFTTSSDLYCFNPEDRVTRRYAFSDMLPGNINNHLNEILKDSKGRLWFGSSGSGVFLYDAKNDSFRQFSVSDGLASGFVTALCEDCNTGLIFISTDKGLTSYDPQSGTFKSYDASNNFPLSFIRNMFITSDGVLFLSDLDKMMSVNVCDLDESPRNYDVLISGLLVDNIPCRPMSEGKKSILKEDIVYQKSIVIPPHHSSLGFEISSTDFQNISSAVAEYKLQGFDQDFTSTSGLHPITYTNLSPGKYTFIVRGLIPDIFGNYPQTQVQVSVERPFYKTAWFLSLALILVMILVFYLFRLWVTSLRLQSVNSTNESKMRFFTGISHEFRTPLTLINGQLEILLNNDRMKPSLYNKILSIYKNTQTLNTLVDEVVDVMKSDSGRLHLHVGQSDIITFMKEIYDTFSDYARYRNIDLKFFTPSSDKILLEFDRRQIQKVFFNILSNAFKYTPAGGEITITAQKSKNGASVSVSDNGPGIDPSHINDVFEMFWQDEKLNAGQSVSSSGIGLALCKTIVELHDGSIRVESLPGKGTCFTVELKEHPHFHTEVSHVDNPISNILQNPLPQIPDAEPESEASESGERPLLLVVEDNEDIRAMLFSLFSRKYNVISAANGEDGLALARKHNPDIIVSDVMMPGISGIEMCRIIKEDIETCHIPVILLTAYALENYMMEGYAMGADDYVAKPFNTKILLARCDNLIRGRKRIQEKFQNQPEASVSILAGNTKDQTLLEKAVAIVKANIGNESFNINNFSRELGLSRTYLFSKIKSLTGLSPGAFISTIRLKEAAARLLSDSSESVADIAYSLGFTSSSYFINCFKQRYGKTPAQYRKSYGKA